MNKQAEALKLVIDFLNREGFIEEHEIQNVIETCKEALEDKQEPAKQKVKILYEENGILTCEILPTATWQSLSDDEIEVMADKYCIKWRIYDFDMPDFAHAIEQALKEKNHPCK